MAVDRREDVLSLVRRALEAGERATMPGGGLSPSVLAPTPTPNYTPSPALTGGVGGDVSEAAFNAALEKFIAASGGKLSIRSGKRSRERQQQLWEQALRKYGDPEIADNWVARPGHSKHELGIAADLAYADEAAKRWAHENAKRYGLHYPLSNEDWHVELLGSR